MPEAPDSWLITNRDLLRDEQRRHQHGLRYLIVSLLSIVADNWRDAAP